SSGLPSSSMSCLTLLAALSVKTSGAGISVTAFIGCSKLALCNYQPAGGQWSIWGGHLTFQFHHAGRFPARQEQELALQGGPEVHFQGLVMNIACDLRLALQFQEVVGVDGAVDAAVDHHVGDVDLPVYPGLLADHQGGRLLRAGSDVALHMAVDAQSA